MTDLKLAVRALTKTPFLTTVAVLSLALGIGANAAIFSIFDQLLLQALPVREPDRLVNLGAPGPKPGSQSCTGAGDCDVVFSYPMYLDLAREQSTLSGLAAHRQFAANLARGDRTVNGEGMLVSGSYFGVLGLRPALGRLLTPADDEVPGEHPVAVLGHRFWRNDLGGDPAVLNSTMVVNGRTLTVVGVAPAGFEGTTLGGLPDVYVPITMRAKLETTFDDFDNRRSYWVYVFGRLAPRVSVEQARADLNGICRVTLAEVEAPLQAGMSEATMERFLAKEVDLEPGRRGQSSVHAEARTPLSLLFGITIVVLIIACANIANLLLARGASRAQEMSIRGSLGASRRQMLKQLLTESLVLALLGGAASLLVANWTLGFIGAIIPPDAVDTMDLGLRPSIVLFTAVVAVATGILFGLYPALHATRRDLVTVLRGSAGQPAGVRAAARFRTALVTAQIALSMALLVGAGLFAKSLMNISRVDLGLDADNVVTFSISPVLNGYDLEQGRAVIARVEQELRAVPGVADATYALIPILTDDSWGNDVSMQGFENGPDVDSNTRYNSVGAGYFRTLGIPLLAGREFSDQDAAGGPDVAIVNEAFTRKFGLDGGKAVGQWMAIGRTGELDRQIVGVVQDARYANVKDETPPLYFTPFLQESPVGAAAFYVRTQLDDPAPVLRAIPSVVRRLDPNLPVENLLTLPQQIRENVFLDHMIGLLSAAFAVLATLLAAVGLYGVLAYTVAQRTREIGLRMALGAARPSVRGMVLRQVGRMFVVGGVIGVVPAVLIGRAAASLLFGLEGHDPVVLVGAGLLLATVALAAAYLPAHRASRVEPMQALRYE